MERRAIAVQGAVQGVGFRPFVHRLASQFGLAGPHDCPAFGTTCIPQTPLGATMVSSKGACAAYYAYGRHLEANKRSRASELVPIGRLEGEP